AARGGAKNTPPRRVFSPTPSVDWGRVGGEWFVMGSLLIFIWGVLGVSLVVFLFYVLIENFLIRFFFLGGRGGCVFGVVYFFNCVLYFVT
ncbi:hypothetical protein, partial [Pseudomonas poae]|uniref:hypothetical protein n=1 Tax=Pseudomonas poae TaxID=200451 RepID=UPI0034D7B6B7